MTEQTAESRIVAALRQQEPIYGTRGMGRQLGISVSMWSRLRDGQGRLSARIADGAARLLPSLEPDVLIFVRYELPLRKRASRNGNKVA